MTNEFQIEFCHLSLRKMANHSAAKAAATTDRGSSTTLYAILHPEERDNKNIQRGVAYRL